MKNAGIAVRLSFMLGSPGETQETMEKTISLAIKLDPDLVQFNITTPYPGTEMFDWAKEKNYLKTYIWRDYDPCKTVMKLPSVDSTLVEKYYRLAYRRFYFRPSFIISRFLKTLTPREMILNLKAFLKILKVILSG